MIYGLLVPTHANGAGQGVWAPRPAPRSHARTHETPNPIAVTSRGHLSGGPVEANGFAAPFLRLLSGLTNFVRIRRSAARRQRVSTAPSFAAMRRVQSLHHEK